MTLIDRLFTTTNIATGWLPPDSRHRLYAGSTGFGKSATMRIDAQASLSDPTRGVHVIDIENELSPPLIAYIARHTPWRRVHLLNPTSTTHAFGLPLLHVDDPRDPQACNNATLRAIAVLGQVVNFQADDFGPRTKKVLTLSLYALVRTGRPLAALPEILTSRTSIRATLAEVMPYDFMREALNALDDLLPRQLIDYTDAPISRLLPILASPVNRRVFGSSQAIDMKRIVAGREVVLLPLSELEHQDAVLIGSAYYSCLHHTALHTPLAATVPTDIYIDEVSNFLSSDLAKGLDRLRKRQFFIRMACQRFAQFQKPDDPAGSVLSAVLTNCRTKVLMGGLPPDDAEILARLVFTGHLQLDTVYKNGSVRPVAVGSDKVTLNSQAHARHHAEQSAHAVSDSRTASRVRALADGTASAWASMAASGQGISASALPDGGFITPPTVMSNALSRNRSSGQSLSGARSQSRMFAEQDGHAHAESISEGSADGVSQAAGSHDAYVTRYANLATEAYSLEEKVHAAVGMLMNLQPRECLVKIDGNAPARLRTPDLVEPFKTPAYRQQVLDLFAQKLARSPYLRPIDVVDAEITSAIKDLAEPEISEPDFGAPEPAPKLRVVKVKGDNRQ